MEIEGQEGQMWKVYTRNDVKHNFDLKNNMLLGNIEVVDTIGATIDINDTNYSGNTNKLSKQKSDAG